MKKIMACVLLSLPTISFGMLVPIEVIEKEKQRVEQQFQTYRALKRAKDLCFSSEPKKQEKVAVNSPSQEITLPNPKKVIYDHLFDKYTLQYRMREFRKGIRCWKDLISDEATKDPYHPCHTSYANNLLNCNWREKTDCLCKAAQTGNILKAYVAIKAGAYLDSGDGNKLPLQYAASTGNVDMIQFLHANGAHLDLCSATALYHAVLSNHLEAVKTLIELGADVGAGGANNKPLLLAAERGYINIAQYLIELRDKYGNRRINIDQQDNAAWTALSHAAWNGHLEMVKVLAGAWLNSNGIYGTPYDLAKHQGHEEIVTYLQGKIGFIL